MSSPEQVMEMVRVAFRPAARPSDDDIVHCDLDAVHGGSLRGPCVECAEVIAFFRESFNCGLSTSELGAVAFGLASFTPEAFRYWLPAFVESSLLHHEAGGRVRESIEFRFRSVDSDTWQQDHFSALSAEQLDAMLAYFKHILGQPSECAEEINKAIGTILQWRSASKT